MYSFFVTVISLLPFVLIIIFKNLGFAMVSGILNMLDSHKSPINYAYDS